MPLAPEALTAFSQLLRSPSSQPELTPELESELLLKGAVVTLQQEGSENALAILQEAALVCPLVSARELALTGIDALAQSGNTLALQALFNLAIEMDHAPARETILRRGYQAHPPARQAVFELLAGQVDTYHKMDPGFGQLTGFYLEEAASALRERLLAAAAHAGLHNWITIVTAAQTLSPEAAAAMLDHYTAFQPAERQLALRLFSSLAREGEAAAQEVLCQLVIIFEEPGAQEITVHEGFMPRDPIRRALFLFLTGQWEAYETFDFDHHLLVTAYETADTVLRKRLLDLSRLSGQSEWFQSLSGANRTRWLRDLSDADWETAIRGLSEAARWGELWRLAQLSAPIWSARILQALAASGWQPPSTDDQTGLALLARLGREALANPLTIRPSRTLLIPSIDDLTAMALSPDGKVLALGTSSNAVHLWQVADIPSPLPVLYGAVAQTRTLAFSPDGDFLASSVGDNTIRVYRWQDGKAAKTLEGHTALVRSLSISPDARTLYSASFDGTLRSWRFPYGPEQKLIARASGEFFGLALSPGGDMLIAGGADPGLPVFQLPEGNQVRVLEGPNATVTNLAAAPTTQFVACYSRDHVIRVWNYTSGREIQAIEYQPGVVTGLCIHPNEQVLVSAGYRGQIHLWSLSTGQALYELAHHKRAVIGLALTPEGDRLVSASADGTVTIWNLKIFLQSRQPVETMRTDQVGEIQKKMTDKTISPQEKKWLEFTLELLRWKQRFDVVIEEPGVISVGEFDIQL